MDGQSVRWAKHQKHEAYYYHDDDLDYDTPEDYCPQQLPVCYEADEEQDEDENSFDDGQI